MLAGTGAFLPWMFLRVGAMAGTVSCATLVLGLEAYGQLVTALAVGSFLSPLAGLGLHMRVMTEWRGTTERRRSWLGALAGEWLVASVICAVLGMTGAFVVFRPHTPHWLLGGVLGLEVFAASGVEWMSRIALMRDGAAAYARVLALFQAGRLLLLLPLGFMASGGLAMFAGVWILATGVTLLGMARAVGVPWPILPGHTAAVTALKAGAPFMAGATAYRLQAEFNKPVIAGMGFALAGALGLAQRVMDVAALPVLALQVGLSQRVFSGAAALRTIVLQAGLSIGMAGLIGLGIVLIAPMIGAFLGSDYAPAVRALAQLAALPALQVLRQTLTLVLVFRAQSRLLPMAELPACAVSMLATVVLVPEIGIVGAIWALYAGEITQVCLQSGLLRFGTRAASAAHP